MTERPRVVLELLYDERPELPATHVLDLSHPLREITDRLGRSPDHLDAAMMAAWTAQGKATASTLTRTTGNWSAGKRNRL